VGGGGSGFYKRIFKKKKGVDVCVWIVRERIWGGCIRRDGMWRCGGIYGVNIMMFFSLNLKDAAAKIHIGCLLPSVCVTDISKLLNKFACI